MDSPIPSQGEALLRAWLELTAILWDRRLVSGLTFNEAVVCNQLKFQQDSFPDAPLTATILCEKTNIRKSQMNQVLNSLEQQGYIYREQSETDRRIFHIHLTEAGTAAYLAAHANASQLLTAVISRMDPENIVFLTEQLQIATVTAQSVMANWHQKGLL